MMTIKALSTLATMGLKSIVAEFGDSRRIIGRQSPKSATTPWAIKKGATFIFTITLANVDRFQLFFHFWIRR